MPNDSRYTTISYNDQGRSTQGMLAKLPPRLATVIEFDALSLDEQPASKKATLWFRHGAKSVFHIRFVRKGGRFLIEMGGLDAAQVLIGIQVCKTHFDQWFGISNRDVTTYERSLDSQNPGSPVKKS